MSRAPRVLVFDSGLGGLTVYAEIARARPDAAYVYAADDAAFPYGAIYGEVLLARVRGVMEELIARHAPDIVVIACNTASTLVLPSLRAAFPSIPFVGTVPAVKPAAAASGSKMITVLATPGTVRRDYTRDLIRDYAAHCEVELVGSSRLAPLAESFMRGLDVSDEQIAAEIAPCFRSHDSRRTDHIVLACTHYPLLLDRFRRLAPWPVEWVDPAPAIARRVLNVLEDRGFDSPAGFGGKARGAAVFTSGAPPDAVLAGVLLRRGLAAAASEATPFSG